MTTEVQTDIVTELAAIRAELAVVREWQAKATAIVEDLGAKANALLENPMVKQMIESNPFGI